MITADAAHVVVEITPPAHKALSAAADAAGHGLTPATLAGAIIERAAADPAYLATCSAQLRREATPPAGAAPVYPWDEWKAAADLAGMAEAAAWAGRAVMRECYQHQWANFMGADIETVCGYRDGGASMFAFGLKYPELAAATWRHMEADDAGNAPTVDPPEEVRRLLRWVYANKRWPDQWPRGAGGAAQ